MNMPGRASTGIADLDEVLQGLRLGDNVVWQIDDIADYKRLTADFVSNTLAEGRKLVYIRFAAHEPIVSGDSGIKTYELDADTGFEGFTAQVHEIIRSEGERTFYVFDCLSDLLSAWATDLMIGNFFAVTCPYLFELDTVTYFGIIRNRHSYEAVARIRETTQLLLEVYDVGDRIFIHPLKVWNRYSPTMFLPHEWRNGSFIPVTDGAVSARFFSHLASGRFKNPSMKLDYWDRLFMEAEELLQTYADAEDHVKTVDKLCRIMIGREEKILALATRYLDLRDLLDIKSRMVGSGYIGGKAAGMLIARNILTKSGTGITLEPHDSYYIGSDVFYTYLVQNGLWRMKMQQKTDEGYYEAAESLRKMILDGKFRENITEQFQQILEYFGQSPIIIRSSSLLEDSYGNAFAGKYESIFCVNSVPPEKRLEEFIKAVKRIYASTMDESALAYRLQRGLDKNDEQMALLIQRVSGSRHGNYFYPMLAGVGNSYNSYVWRDDIDPEAGILRLVYGLGTRAVDRIEGDYPRMVSLDKPMLQPLAAKEEVRQYSQHDVDVLDLTENTKKTIPISRLIEEDAADLIESFGECAYDYGSGDKKLRECILTFKTFFKQTDFLKDMRSILNVLQDVYDYPVDIEFTVNFDNDGSYRINLLQCRPLQTKVRGRTVLIPKNIADNDILFSTSGNFMGGSISAVIDTVIFIVPEEYSALAQNVKYTVARAIGRINADIGRQRSDGEGVAMLITPGRCGTTTPSLGVPVSFAEIGNMAVICEVSFTTAGFMPELSYCTHFFQDLVETGIFYAALFREQDGTVFSEDVLLEKENLLAKLYPNYGDLQNVVKLIRFDTAKLSLMSDVSAQRLICFRI